MITINRNDEKTFKITISGPSMLSCTTGMFLAAFLSAAINHSFWWGVLHFVLGWIYVAYKVADYVAPILAK